MRQVIPILAPRGGVRYDIPGDLISPLEMSDCRNVFLQDGLVKKRYGYTTFGGNLPLAGPVLGFDQFSDYASNSYLLAVTTKNVYKYTSPSSSPYWETIHETEVEDDCETTWTSDMGANGAVADESTIKKVGTKSQKISPGAGFTTGLAAHRDQALGDKSAYSFVRLWIRSSVAQAAGDLQFCIDDTAGCGSATETLDIPALTANTWKLVFLEASDPSSNMNAIASLGLSIATDNGACDIYIDDIQFVKAFSSSVAYNTTEEDYASFTTIRDTTQTDPWWILTNGVDAIKKWTGSGAVSNLITSYPSGVTALLAEIVLEFKSHLLLFDVSENGNRYPQRVRWSDTADPVDFLNGNASYIDLSGMDRVQSRSDWITGAIKYKNDYVVVGKENSIWLGYATGESDVFQFDMIVPGKGCSSGLTMKSNGEDVLYLGHDDVYAFDGIESMSIGESVREEIFATMNPDGIRKSFAVLMEEQYEYWVFVVDTADDYCDKCWCFNYSLNKWTRHAVADFLTAYGDYTKQTQLTIGDLVGTIGEQTWRIGERATLAAMPVTIFGDVDGYVYEYDTTANNDNGTAIDSWFSTKDFNPTRLTQNFTVTRLDVYYTGAGLDVGYSIDKGTTWTQIESLTANNDMETPYPVWCKVDAPMIRFRYRNAESGEHFEFSRANIYWKPSGMRIK